MTLDSGYAEVIYPEGWAASTHEGMQADWWE